MSVEGIKVTMKGLGQPLNSIVPKTLSKLLQRHLPQVLEGDAEPVIRQALNNANPIQLPPWLTKCLTFVT